ncbi:MAG: tyrosine-type recombinase/integrase [Planctomycetaceae bacterium]|nr:tyrosine-type recombinase/integrase [Planctomycetaceae bacterium]
MTNDLPEIRITTYRGEPHFTWGNKNNKRRRKIKNPNDENAVQRQKAQLITEILVQQEGGQILKRVKVPLEQHITDFLKDASRKCGPDHLKAKEKRLRRVLEVADIKHVDQLDAARIDDAIRSMRQVPASPHKDVDEYPILKTKTKNDYRKTIKQFSRWLYRKNRTEAHALHDLDMEQVRDNTKRIRFQPDELELLINAAMESERTVEGYDGTLRAWLYILAVSTGYRRKELGAITADSFDFESDPPTLTVRIGQTKNKKEASQPFRAELVPALKEFLASREGHVFPNLLKPEPPKTCRMIDSDMEEACIPKTVKEGKRDFHSLRHTFVSSLAASGLAITDIQVMSRHSDLQTVAGYMHSNRGVAKRAVEVLPSLPLPGTPKA